MKQGIFGPRGCLADSALQKNKTGEADYIQPSYFSMAPMVPSSEL